MTSPNITTSTLTSPSSHLLTILRSCIAYSFSKTWILGIHRLWVRSFNVRHQDGIFISAQLLENICSYKCWFLQHREPEYRSLAITYFYNSEFGASHNSHSRQWVCLCIYHKEHKDKLQIARLCLQPRLYYNNRFFIATVATIAIFWVW